MLMLIIQSDNYVAAVQGIKQGRYEAACESAGRAVLSNIQINNQNNVIL